MSFTFPKSESKKRGYLPEQVDSFISRAREQFNNPQLDVVTANEVRNTEFDLVNGGYRIESVDLAMDKLEDSFAAREIDSQRLQNGAYALEDRQSRLAELIHGRTQRPKGKKFSNTGYLLRGYSRKQVDSLCEHIERGIQSDSSLLLKDVRRAVFDARRRGYSESQVDAFIDRVIELIQIDQAR